MKNIRDSLDLKHKKPLRLALLLLSTLFIISASSLVYATMIYEKALNVGNATGVTTGSGSTASAEARFPAATIVILAVSGLVISLSIFGVLREASKHISSAPGGRGSSPTGPVSMQGEEWEESPRKEEDEE